jgi:hypothetical protein
MADSLTNLQALLVLPVRQAQECLKPPLLAQPALLWEWALVRLVQIPMLLRWLDNLGKLNGLEPTRTLTIRTTGVVCCVQLTNSHRLNISLQDTMGSKPDNRLLGTRKDRPEDDQPSCMFC